MQYRKFPRIPKVDVSLLGFGCMRLPIENSDSSKIDETKAIAMIRHAIDNGVNYVDTAWPYHQGNSESVVGKALKDGYRKKALLATKNPVWLVNEYEDFEKYLDLQLERLQTDYIDFYLLHALNRRSWAKIKELGAIDFLNDALAKGKIKYAGFSIHDDTEVFKEIIDAYDWHFAQIQLNYMDEHFQAGIEGMKYAASKNIGIIVMEPLRGGSLTRNVPEDIQAVWDRAETRRTPAEWALRWVCNHPEVITVLSGMNEMDHLTENMKTVENASPNSLTEEELALVDEVKELYRARIQVNCTQCRYCVPCPMGVEVPSIFTLYNNAYMYNSRAGEKRNFGKLDMPFLLSSWEYAAAQYKGLGGREKDATRCVECGKCEEACPQNIEIIKKLKEAHNYLTK